MLDKSILLEVSEIEYQIKWSQKLLQDFKNHYNIKSALSFIDDGLQLKFLS